MSKTVPPLGEEDRQWLTEKMRAKHLSQEKLAQAAGIAQMTVSRWSRGQTSIAMDAARAIEELLGEPGAFTDGPIAEAIELEEAPSDVEPAAIVPAALTIPIHAEIVDGEVQVTTDGGSVLSVVPADVVESYASAPEAAAEQAEPVEAEHETSGGALTSVAVGGDTAAGDAPAREADGASAPPEPALTPAAEKWNEWVKTMGETFTVHGPDVAAHSCTCCHEDEARNGTSSFEDAESKAIVQLHDSLDRLITQAIDSGSFAEEGHVWQLVLHDAAESRLEAVRVEDEEAAAGRRIAEADEAAREAVRRVFDELFDLETDQVFEAIRGFQTAQRIATIISTDILNGAA